MNNKAKINEICQKANLHLSFHSIEKYVERGGLDFWKGSKYREDVGSLGFLKLMSSIVYLNTTKKMKENGVRAKEFVGSGNGFEFVFSINDRGRPILKTFINNNQ